MQGPRLCPHRLPSASGSLAALESSQKQNHTALVLLGLALSTWHNVLGVTVTAELGISFLLGERYSSACRPISLGSSINRQLGGLACRLPWLMPLWTQVHRRRPGPCVQFFQLDTQKGTHYWVRRRCSAEATSRYIPTKGAQRSQFLCILVNTCYFLLVIC